MSKHLPLLGAALCCVVAAGAQTYTPIPVTGFNHDIFAEAAPSVVATTDTVLDATNHIMYTQAFATAAGIPGGVVSSGLISDPGNVRQYQLAPYTGNNALTLMRNVSRSLALAAPAAYSRLSLLAFSTEGASTINITLRFADGTSAVYAASRSVSDWFFATTNVVTSGFGRINRVAAAPYGQDGLPGNPRFYYVDFNLNCTDQLKNVTEVVLTNNTTTGSNAPFPNAVILAVSGQAYSQSVSVATVNAGCGTANGSATLLITGTTGPYTVSWNSTPVQTGLSASNLAAGSYTATITNAFGCSSTQTVTIAQNASTVTTSVAAAPATICRGAGTQLSVTGTGGSIATALWNPGGLTGTTVTVSPTATTAYTVTGTDGAGCPYTGSVTVTVNDLPAAAAATGTTICGGATATLTVQGAAAGNTYNWYAAATGGTALATGTTFTTPALGATTTYYLDVVNGAGCSAATRTPVTVTVNPQPTAPTVTAATVCGGATVTLTITNVQAGATYTWYNAATGGTLLFTGTAFTTPALSATTTYYVDAMSGAGCLLTARVPVTVTVTPQPAAPAVGNVLVCPGAAAQLDVQAPQAGITYSWFAAATGGTALFTGSSFTTPGITAPTTYYVQAANGAGCTSPSRAAATVTPLAVLPAPVVTVTSLTSNSVTFSWTAVPGATGYLVSTNGGATTAAPSSGATGTTHTVTGATPGQVVALVVKALGGQACQNSPFSAPASATPADNQVYVPNTFTPNNDGKNDELRAYSTSIASIEFRVFDQWGNALFVSTDPARGWDGTVRGVRQPQGVYIYALRATMTDGAVLTRKGSVNLLR
ncbi:gliding motility-associated C-terminal domain-containing protein [Flaviaesturariibacter amylovorans]|uniref:Fibronectin type-III domain-containing protein n=1 Tax=Flaviaesturariibacter amylovorans TaxID=1084520 RepID=A0ABP8HTQ8_9BACT